MIINDESWNKEEIVYLKVLSRDGVIMDRVWTRNHIYWTLTRTLVTTNKDDNLTELHTSNIIINTAHIKLSQSSLAVAL
jgi:hypothetical protein